MSRNDYIDTVMTGSTFTREELEDLPTEMLKDMAEFALSIGSGGEDESHI